MKYLSIFILLIVAAGCSSTEKTIEEAMNELKDSLQEEDRSLVSNVNLENLRTQLSDAYAYRENQIPEAFNQVRIEQKVEKNLYEGYRIQIYSGQDVANADTIAAHFKAWADTTITGYYPDTYVFFRTPYYRVHVGDFHERNQAIKFSNMVKRFFSDAWVVYDKVNPNKVPADTTVIEMK
ncbi:MAG: SPOR domain-containing protein [Balneolaceae bacterium]